MVGEVAGVGMLGVIELVRDSKTGAPFDPALKVGPFLAERALAHGLVVRAMGDRVGFAPPLIIGRAELDELFDKFAAALEDTRAWAKSRAGTAPA
jgi:4-aminobutyrate--pyruvate transaminase